MRGRGLGRALVVVLVPLGGSAVPLAAQGVPTVTDRVDVRLVEVDAWAHDGSRPVLDLGADNDVVIARFDRELEVLLSLTADASRVAPALRGMAASGLRAIEASLEERRTLEAIRQIQRRGVDDSQSPLGSSVERLQGEDAAPQSQSAVSLPCSMEMLRLEVGLATGGG